MNLRLVRSRDRHSGKSGKKRGSSRLMLFGAIRQIPSFARLLAGLFRDARVSTADKLLAGAALAYLVMPADFVADFIPFLGMVDDVFLVALTLRRLIRNAGMRRVVRYWEGDPRDLRVSRIVAIISAARMFLPARTRRRLSRGAGPE